MVLHRRILFALVAVASLLLTLVPTAEAARPPSIPYLALGDSLPYGWDVVTQPVTVAPSEHVGYPEVLAQRSPLAVTNASCPGETSGSFIDRSTADNGCGSVLAGPGIKVDWDGGSQLDYAVEFLAANPDTGLVTIMLGANDLFLCQATEGGCTPTEFGQVLASTGANLATIIGTLRATGYDGPIVLVGYYALDYTDPAQVTISSASRTVMTQVAAGFDQVVVADGFAAFEQASRRAGGDPCEAGLLLVVTPGTCDVHTSPRGDRVLARAVHRAIDLGAIVSGAVRVGPR